jgi:hypothetical protein
MAYFADLTPYAYGRRSHPGVVHVGWLDDVHDFPRGEVPQALIEKLRLLAESPVELYAGDHQCELCEKPEDAHLFEVSKGHWLPNEAWTKWIEPRLSCGEIRVARGGVTYAAPMIIAHYIEAHGYLPPAEFLKAVEEAPINRPVYRVAEEIASKAHAGQFRFEGVKPVVPYMKHLRAVVQRMRYDPEAEALAWLHDVLAEGDETEASLKKAGIPSHLIAAVALMTRAWDTSYEDHFERIARSPLATKVMIANLIVRLTGNPTPDELRRYADGLYRLTRQRD